jgi:cytoskeletal protein RodZ
MSSGFIHPDSGGSHGCVAPAGAFGASIQLAAVRCGFAMKHVLSICAIVLGLFLIAAGAVPSEPAGGGFVTRHELSIEVKRIDDLLRAYIISESTSNEVDTKRVDSKLASESQRIDALLTAAKADVTLANARAELTASALAERVDTSAKALAAQVEVTAKAAASATDAQAKAFSERITPLEQMRYETAGRGAISTPLLMVMATLSGSLLMYVILRATVKRPEEVVPLGRVNASRRRAMPLPPIV